MRSEDASHNRSQSKCSHCLLYFFDSPAARNRKSIVGKATQEHKTHRHMLRKVELNLYFTIYLSLPTLKNAKAMKDMVSIKALIRAYKTYGIFLIFFLHLNIIAIAKVLPDGIVSCFEQRVEEFKSMHSKLKHTEYPWLYARSQYSVQDFMHRVAAFKSEYSKLKHTEYPWMYAISGHTVAEYMNRVVEFNTQYSDLKHTAYPWKYAISDYSLSDFMNRVIEFQKAYPDMKQTEYPLMYAQSKHSLAEYMMRVKSYQSNHSKIKHTAYPWIFGQSVHEDC